MHENFDTSSPIHAPSPVESDSFNAPIASFVTISLLLMVGAFLPVQAHAFSITDMIPGLSKFTAEAPAAAASTSGNVQTMSLSQPAHNINPAPDTGGGDILIDGNALVPKEGPSGTIADIVKPKKGNISIYVVRPGDTLSQIALMYDVDVKTIKGANNIGKKDHIHPGDLLVILPIVGVQHTVAQGDTLDKIAKKYGSNAEEIALYNDSIDDSDLADLIGQTITIPDGEVTEVAEAPTPGKKPGKKPGKGSLYNPARNVGPAGTPDEIAYYHAPLASYVKTQGLHGWNAVDLATPIGSPVYASAAGRVVIAREGGWNGGYGSFVVIEHDNGSQTLYAHLSSVNTYTGATVAQGENIAFSGSSGKSTGPHLHFEIRNGIRNPF